ncbi:uncharacterized protein ABDE67_010522 [Symphorus nematophorus]
MRKESSSNLLLLLLLLLLLTVSEGGSSSSVVGRTGEDVTLTCKYDIKSNGVRSVCWGRGQIPNSGCSNQLISTDGHEATAGVSGRYQLLGRLDEGDVSLTILNLTETDAGRYGCRVDIYGWFNDEKHHFDLTVEPAPTVTTTTAQRGSDVILWTGSDVTGNRPTVSKEMLAQQMWSTAVQLQRVDDQQPLIGKTLRASFIILIPALLLTAAYISRRQKSAGGPETDRRLHQSEEEEEEEEERPV